MTFLDVPAPPDWDLVGKGESVPARSAKYASLIEVLLDYDSLLVGYWYPEAHQGAHGSLRVSLRDEETSYARALQERKTEPYVDFTDVLEYECWEQEIPAGRVIGTSALLKDCEENLFSLSVTADVFFGSFPQAFTFEFITSSLEHAEAFRMSVSDIVLQAGVQH